MTSFILFVSALILGAYRIGLLIGVFSYSKFLKKRIYFLEIDKACSWFMLLDEKKRGTFIVPLFDLIYDDLL